MFKQTGCYTMRLVNRIFVISFNAMHFGVKNKPSNDPASISLIFRWLDEQLEYARRQELTALLVYHIPHGEFLTPVGTEVFWVPTHEEKFRQLLSRYRATIGGIYTGHLHFSALNSTKRFSTRDLVDWEMTRLYDYDYYGPEIVNRAVSPLFDNNPGFTLFYYTDTMEYPKYYEEYTFPLTVTYNKTAPPDDYWVYLYSSLKDLGIKNLSARSMYEFMDTLYDDYRKFFKYMMWRLGRTLYEPDAIESIMEAVCGSYSNDLPAYSMCIDSLKSYIKEGLAH